MFNHRPFVMKNQYFLLFLCIIIFGTAAIFLGQDNNWDLRDYHFYNGYAFFHPTLFTQNIMPAMVQTYINPFFDSFNYLAIAIQYPPITKFLLGALSGVCCFFVYKIAIILFTKLPNKQRNIYALFALIMGASGSIGIGLIGTTTNDTKMTLLILMSLYFLIRYVTEEKTTSHKRYLILAGLLIGLDAGFKLPAFCYAIGLSIGLLFSKPWSLRHFYHFIIFTAWIVFGFLIANGYWMYFLNHHFGNPLFPYYNNIFHSPYAPIRTYKDPNFYPQYLFQLPFHIAKGNVAAVSDSALKDLRLAILYVASIIFFIKYIYQRLTLKNSITNSPIGEKSPWLLVTYWAISSYLIWFYNFSIYRYILPIELLTSVFLTYIVCTFFKRELIRYAVLLVFILIFSVTTSYPNWGRIPSGKQFFTVETPVLPQNSTILFLSAPLAYVIPFFPLHTRFIGIPFYIDDNKITNQIFRHLKGPLFSLQFLHSNSTELASNKILLQHGIHTQDIKCHIINTNIGDSLKLCPLDRSTK